MAIRDQIYPVYKSRDFAACNRILDTVSPGKDREEWHSITYWRSTILEAEGHFNDALVVLEHGREGFDCRSLYAFMTTQLLVRLGRTAQAISVLKSAPIVAEHERFYGLTLEAAYYLCSLLIGSGQQSPAEILAIIPDDFITMDCAKRFVGKSDLLRRTV